ncbi:ankyrin repeat domain-containing protein [Siccirubricoccus deserti]
MAGAAFKGDLQVVRLLLENGAAVDGRADGGRTPLILAAMFNRTAIVELL